MGTELLNFHFKNYTQPLNYQNIILQAYKSLIKQKFHYGQFECNIYYYDVRQGGLSLKKIKVDLNSLSNSELKLYIYFFKYN